MEPKQWERIIKIHISGKRREKEKRNQKHMGWIEKSKCKNEI